jgi:hypothetical protein
MFHRRAVNNLNNKSSLAVRPQNEEAAHLNGSVGRTAQHHHRDDGSQAGSRMSVAGALLDYSFMLFLVIGGCCSYVSTSLQHTQVFMTINYSSNVWAYEELLRAEPNVGAYESPFHPPMLAATLFWVILTEPTADCQC